MYKKEYEQVFENKDESWRKNLKDFGCQVDEVYKADVTEKEDEDETDQELTPWIKVPKSRINEIKDVITRPNESKLMARLEKRNITLKNAEKVREGIISGKINQKKVKDMYNNIAEDVNKLNKLKPTESRKKMLPIFKQLEEIFMGSKADEKVDDEADEQPDTADMPELESEESTAQQGQGVKILSKQQMIARLPVLLAGNNYKQQITHKNLKMK